MPESRVCQSLTYPLGIVVWFCRAQVFFFVYDPIIYKFAIFSNLCIGFQGRGFVFDLRYPVVGILYVVGRISKVRFLFVIQWDPDIN